MPAVGHRAIRRCSAIILTRFLQKASFPLELAKILDKAAQSIGSKGLC
jgi:hypothetical protein